MNRLDEERMSIGQVLEIYREGCNNALNRLFTAQDDRIRLYKQQMAALQKRQTDIQRALIDQLEQNHKQIQERLTRQMAASGIDG